MIPIIIVLCHRFNPLLLGVTQVKLSQTLCDLMLTDYTFSRTKRPHPSLTPRILCMTRHATVKWRWRWWTQTLQQVLMDVDLKPHVFELSLDDSFFPLNWHGEQHTYRRTNSFLMSCHVMSCHVISNKRGQETQHFVCLKRTTVSFLQ